MHLLVDANLVEDLTIGKGTVDFPRENGTEIDDLLHAILKEDA